MRDSIVLHSLETLVTLGPAGDALNSIDAPNLLRLEIFDAELGTRIPTSIHRHLRKLTISSEYDGYRLQLNSVDYPNLRELDLTFMVNSEGWIFCYFGIWSPSALRPLLYCSRIHKERFYAGLSYNTLVIVAP